MTVKSDALDQPGLCNHRTLPIYVGRVSSAVDVKRNTFGQARECFDQQRETLLFM